LTIARSRARTLPGYGVPTNPRKLPKQDRSRETVENILEATARVLAREGYARASTNRIATESGYGIGSLYEYFPNKESLVAALVHQHAEKMLVPFYSWSRSCANVPLPAAVRALVQAAVEARSLEPELRRVLIEQAPRAGDLDLARAVEDRIAGLLRDYLEQHEEDVCTKDLLLAASLSARAVSYLLLWSSAHNTSSNTTEVSDDEKLAEEVAALMLSYLSAPGRG
jgi:AcrR family transcriptional regulator